MKGSVASDLHLEFHALADLPGNDILILSGDIWTVAPMRPRANDADSRALRKRYIKFCEEELSKYKHVLLVMGNHEHYGGIFEETADTLRTFLAKHAPQAVLLDNEAHEIDGVLFLGSTLWATYGHGTGSHVAIQQQINDFHMIRTHKWLYDYPPPSQGRTLIVPEFNSEHLHSQFFLREELQKNKGKPTVVITHYAPSWMCLIEWSRFLNEAYASNQHELIAEFQPVMWTYGHTHDSARRKLDETLVVSNQRGYFGCERCSRFFNISDADFDLEDVKERKLFTNATAD